MIEEFEGSVSSTVVHGHHEQNPGFQNTFATDVLHLVASFEELGNSFSEEGEELMALNPFKGNHGQLCCEHCAKREKDWRGAV